MNDEDFYSNTAAISLSSYKQEIYVEDKRWETLRQILPWYNHCKFIKI